VEKNVKLLIAVDMEGISGVVSWDQVTPDSTEWQRFRRIMTNEVNAAIQGAMLEGVDEVIVTDGHWRGDNIVIENLDQRARLNCGGPSQFAMVQAVDQGVDFAFFIGYHARMGSKHAILDHTWSSTIVANIWLNGNLVGETGLNAALCAHFNVPVILLTGDQAVTLEARELIPGIEIVEVKKANSRFSADCLHPAITHNMILEAAKDAVKKYKAGNTPLPLKFETPILVEIEFRSSDMADKVEIMPGIIRIDGRKIRFSCETMPDAYCEFRKIVNMAG
jgi:D-amino peptidase